MRNVLFAIALLLPITAYTQSSQADLQARLVDKPLYLLGPWSGNSFRFDEAGHLLGQSKIGSFTLSGIDIQSVGLNQKGLEIRGTRAGLIFGKNGAERVEIALGVLGTPQPITVQIAPPANSDYNAALNAIYTDNLAACVPSLPDYWQFYGAKYLCSGTIPAAEPAGGKPDPTFPKIDPTRTTPPEVLRALAPVFTQEARSAKISGRVLVYLQIDTTGMPTHLQIIRPLGMGQDELAVEAVFQV